MSEWEKLTGETDLSYLWFSRYRDMGAERSLTNVLQKYHKGAQYKSQLGKWSGKFNWAERCSAYDAYMEEKTRATLENRKLKMEEEHVDIAQTAKRFVLDGLKDRDPKKESLQSLKGLLELAIKTERDALHVVDEHKISGDINVTDKNAERIAAEIGELTRKALAVRDGEDDAAE